MTYLLPPLNALRAFEAAARHLSFKLAAQELHVTPGAVAQQVRSLEVQLGFALFERLHRQLMLTSAGQAYLPPLRDAFTRIAAATDALEPRHARAIIRLGVRGRYDLTDLTRRIDRFRAEQGRDVHVRISYPAGFDELLEGKVSAVIDRSLGQQPGFRCDRLDLPAAGRSNGPADHLIYPIGVADCPEIVALRDCLLAGDTDADVVPAASRLSRAVG